MPSAATARPILHLHASFVPSLAPQIGVVREGFYSCGGHDQGPGLEVWTAASDVRAVRRVAVCTPKPLMHYILLNNLNTFPSAAISSTASIIAAVLARTNATPEALLRHRRLGSESYRAALALAGGECAARARGPLHFLGIIRPSSKSLVPKHNVFRERLCGNCCHSQTPGPPAECATTGDTGRATGPSLALSIRSASACCCRG
mmetsp:Transcript_104455/g.223303  ORF Transcript_104455/g.223303 Transcript_104455/m.223303 type:complete len:204 (+) Transcript_104455:139-750(+)